MAAVSSEVAGSVRLVGELPPGEACWIRVCASDVLKLWLHDVSNRAKVSNATEKILFIILYSNVTYTPINIGLATSGFCEVFLLLGYSFPIVIATRSPIVGVPDT